MDKTILIPWNSEKHLWSNERTLSTQEYLASSYLSLSQEYIIIDIKREEFQSRKCKWIFIHSHPVNHTKSRKLNHSPRHWQWKMKNNEMWTEGVWLLHSEGSNYWKRSRRTFAIAICSKSGEWIIWWDFNLVLRYLNDMTT